MLIILVLLILCFPIYNSVYAKYCQSYRKICKSMKSKTLSLKTIINELGFLRKTVIIQWNVWKKNIYFCLQTH